MKCVVEVLCRPSAGTSQDSQFVKVVASSPHEDAEEATEDSLAATNPDSDSNQREDSRLVRDVGSSQRTSGKEADVGRSNFCVVEFVGRGASGQENDAGSRVCVIGRRKG
jgi:hypothetical protein